MAQPVVVQPVAVHPVPVMAAPVMVPVGPPCPACGSLPASSTMSANMDAQKEEIMVLESIMSCANNEEEGDFQIQFTEIQPAELDEQKQQTELHSAENRPGAAAEKVGASHLYHHQGQGTVTVPPLEENQLEVSVTVGKNVKTAKIVHLPPLYVYFWLSSDYPSDNSPLCRFAALWLDAAIHSRLKEETQRICEENLGQSVIFTLMQGIQDILPSFFQSQLNLDTFQPIRNNTAVCSVKRQMSKSRQRRISAGSSQNAGARLTAEQLFALLVDYNQFGTKRQFDSQWFTCEVCFEEKMGRECLKFSPCAHVFCKECVGGYFAVQIREGAVRDLSCLAEKCNSQATPQQVREAVQNDVLYERYDSLLLSQTLELMSDIVPCPRPSCQQPVLLERDQGSEGEPILAPMASCPSCDMNFCTYCRKVYHGISECAFTAIDQKRLIEEYQQGDSRRKSQMEQRYGKRTLLKLLDDFLAEDWIRENSKPCPHCSANIQKKDGCNKMWCRKCGSFFCWLCLQVLSRSDPYNHFNNPKQGCYNKLFLGVESDEEEFDDDDDFDDDDFPGGMFVF